MRDTATVLEAQILRVIQFMHSLVSSVLTIIPTSVPRATVKYDAPYSYVPYRTLHIVVKVLLFTRNNPCSSRLVHPFTHCRSTSHRASELSTCNCTRATTD